MSVDKDGILTASTVTDPSGAPRQWREIGPWIWQEVNGADKLQAVLDGNGHIKMFSITPYAPIIEFLPAPASLNAGWILPVGTHRLDRPAHCGAGLADRRADRAAATNINRTSADAALQLHRATRATAWLYIVFAIGWVLVLNAVNNDLTALNGGIDIWMRLLQLILIVAIIGTFGCDLERLCRGDRSRPASGRDTLGDRHRLRRSRDGVAVPRRRAADRFAQLLSSRDPGRRQRRRRDAGPDPVRASARA